VPNIRAGFVDQGKVIMESHKLLTDKESLPKTIANVIETTAPLDNTKMTEIGIGVHSVADTVNGIVSDVVTMHSRKGLKRN